MEDNTTEKRKYERSRVVHKTFGRNENGKKRIAKIDAFVKVIQLQLIFCALIFITFLAIKVANNKLYETVKTGNFGAKTDFTTIEKFNNKVDELAKNNKFFSFLFGKNKKEDNKDNSSKDNSSNSVSSESSENNSSSTENNTSSAVEETNNSSASVTAVKLNNSNKNDSEEILTDVELNYDYEFKEIDDVLLKNVKIPNYSFDYYKLPEIAVRPLDTGYLTDPFGFISDPFTKKLKFHTGLDIGVKTGTPVKSIMNGTVTKANEDSNSGKYIVVEHADGFASVYCHLSEIKVKVGDKVANGQVIALSGSSGKSTGAHLHFNLKKDGMYLNPANYFLYLPK